jgi:hypothetical protein
MTWIARPGSVWRSPRKSRKSTTLWRADSLPITFRVAVFSAEQVHGAVADVVVAAPLGHTRQHGFKACRPAGEPNASMPGRCEA